MRNRNFNVHPINNSIVRIGNPMNFKVEVILKTRAHHPVDSDGKRSLFQSSTLQSVSKTFFSKPGSAVGHNLNVYQEHRLQKRDN